MFGTNSQNAIPDFLSFLSDETSSYVSHFLRELTEELYNQDCATDVRTVCIK